eukprot:2250859-Lingulodinium_polyedra.AAC.1
MASAYSRIELPAGERAYRGTLDLEDGFYQMLLPEEWRPFFCLGVEEARNFGVFSLHGRAVGTRVRLRPRLRPLPMG